MSPNTLTSTFGLCLLAAAAGCASWTKVATETSQLPAPRMSPDSVVLEIAFLRMPPGSAEINDAVWAEIDEQHLPAELRRQLSANGFRCGLIGSQVPTELRRLLDSEQGSAADSSENQLPVDGSAAAQHRRLQSRAGRRGEIVTCKTRERMVVLTHEDGGVRGETLSDAVGLFAVKTYPQGDGRVRLELTPEVHHGQPRNRWVAEDGSLRLEAGRERKVFERLRIEPTLSPGHTLLLTCTPDIKGLGQQFFTDDSGGRLDQVVVLMRLAQTQFDDLFAPEQILSPIATVAE